MRSESGGEATREEKRLGRRNDSGGETSPEEKRLRHPALFEHRTLQVTSNAASLRIALSLPWFAAGDEPTRVEAVSSRKR
jgi:hypothetical protein